MNGSRKKLFLEQFIHPLILEGASVREALQSLLALSWEFHHRSKLQTVDYHTSATIGMFLQAYLRQEAKIYQVAERFGLHLAKTKLDLPTTLVPHKLAQTYLIEFPKGITFKSLDGYCFFNSCIIKCGFSSEHKDVKSLSIVAPDFDDKGNHTNKTSLLNFALFPDMKIQEAVEYAFANPTIPDASKRNDGIPSDLVEYALKVLLYIESNNPDLHSEVGFKPTTKKPKKLFKQLDDKCLLDCTTVGYSFHGRMQHIDETTVSGHFRWQPHGPQLSLLKLIWIDEHIRKFKQGES